jgi:hypothetical protein
MDEAAHFTGLFFVDEAEWIEVFNLGGEADWVAGKIECLDLRHATLSCEESCPDILGGISYSADETDTCDDDAPLLIRLGHAYLAAF